MNEVKIGKKYRHFKGHIIEILLIGKNSENLENMVVYKHTGTNEIWIRPEKMFFDTEDISTREDNITHQKYRFELIEDNNEEI